MCSQWRRLVVCGRARIISCGENIYCAKVENVLAPIGEVAVIGSPHDKWGEVPVAITALGASAQAVSWLADLDEFLTEKLARYKHLTELEGPDDGTDGSGRCTSV